MKIDWVQVGAGVCPNTSKVNVFVDVSCALCESFSIFADCKNVNVLGFVFFYSQLISDSQLITNIEHQPDGMFNSYCWCQLTKNVEPNA